MRFIIHIIATSLVLWATLVLARSCAGHLTLTGPSAVAHTARPQHTGWVNVTVAHVLNSDVTWSASPRRSPARPNRRASGDRPASLSVEVPIRGRLIVDLGSRSVSPAFQSPVTIDLLPGALVAGPLVIGHQRPSRRSAGCLGGVNGGDVAVRVAQSVVRQLIVDAAGWCGAVHLRIADSFVGHDLPDWAVLSADGHADPGFEAGRPLLDVNSPGGSLAIVNTVLDPVLPNGGRFALGAPVAELHPADAILRRAHERLAAAVPSEQQALVASMASPGRRRRSSEVGFDVDPVTSSHTEDSMTRRRSGAGTHAFAGNVKVSDFSMVGHEFPSACKQLAIESIPDSDSKASVTIQNSKWLGGGNLVGGAGKTGLIDIRLEKEKSTITASMTNVRIECVSMQEAPLITAELPKAADSTAHQFTVDGLTAFARTSLLDIRGAVGAELTLKDPSKPPQVKLSNIVAALTGVVPRETRSWELPDKFDDKHMWMLSAVYVALNKARIQLIESTLSLSVPAVKRDLLDGSHSFQSDSYYASKPFDATRISFVSVSGEEPKTTVRRVLFDNTLPDDEDGSAGYWSAIALGVGHCDVTVSDVSALGADRLVGPIVGAGSHKLYNKRFMEGLTCGDPEALITCCEIKPHHKVKEGKFKQQTKMLFDNANIKVEKGGCTGDLTHAPAELIGAPTDPPVTNSPVTDSPVTEAPVTGAPVTDSPVTEAPVTDSPVTEAPVTDSPVTEAPVTETPVTDSPVTDSPVTDSPVTNSPVTDSPVTDSPVTEAPVGDSSIAVPGGAAGFPGTDAPGPALATATAGMVDLGLPPPAADAAAGAVLGGGGASGGAMRGPVLLHVARIASCPAALAGGGAAAVGDRWLGVPRCAAIGAGPARCLWAPILVSLGVPVVGGVLPNVAAYAALRGYPTVRRIVAMVSLAPVAFYLPTAASYSVSAMQLSDTVGQAAVGFTGLALSFAALVGAIVVFDRTILAAASLLPGRSDTYVEVAGAADADDAAQAAPLRPPRPGAAVDVQAPDSADAPTPELCDGVAAVCSDSPVPAAVEGPSKVATAAAAGVVAPAAYFDRAEVRDSPWLPLLLTAGGAKDVGRRAVRSAFFAELAAAFVVSVAGGVRAGPSSTAAVCWLPALVMAMAGLFLCVYFIAVRPHESRRDWVVAVACAALIVASTGCAMLAAADAFPSASGVATGLAMAAGASAIVQAGFNAASAIDFWYSHLTGKRGAAAEAVSAQEESDGCDASVSVPA